MLYRPSVSILGLFALHGLSSTAAAAAVDGQSAAFTSPVYLADVAGPTNVPDLATAYPAEQHIQSKSLNIDSYKLDRSKYPEPLKQPPTDSPELRKVIASLDWSKIPAIQPRKVVNWVLDIKSYDVNADPDCWWSSSLCKRPKLAYLPEDIYMCPNPGDWGLNYDDGPYRVWFPQSPTDKDWEEPRFYNFLVEHGKQKATLFFVGSNVMAFPAAAQRALNDGHTICSHTWSHPQMTTLTNEEVVGQLYWTQKAIKEALGITPKCWRPPYGDVDDRVRAIAWQMGMRTILWDQDSNDWNLYGGPARGHLTAEEHENSNSTVSMAERWLPKLQKHFNVMPIHQCINDPKPYWEESWVYPTLTEGEPNHVLQATARKPGLESASAPQNAAMKFVSPSWGVPLLLVTYLWQLQW
ncbi:uncharacterized protein BYT42DRAFT_634051 [Radiomyces spectabilis]|uniref:uncharacterized protein n=1 Tax=Radiomyces spectabilis TaxID=64574 RepID=UPI00221EBA2B|nr:uncharacterized protein BYT42DRAFT_634051 [Radiomyces spectabilis]KAI8380968.1 hypothetical protein BYT42DRAFT_634051 [Radiomyces spectabilis]